MKMNVDTAVLLSQHPRARGRVHIALFTVPSSRTDLQIYEGLDRGICSSVIRFLAIDRKTLAS